jgi:hypothetical protein
LGKKPTIINKKVETSHSSRRVQIGYYVTGASRVQHDFHIRWRSFMSFNSNTTGVTSGAGIGSLPEHVSSLPHPPFYYRFLFPMYIIDCPFVLYLLTISLNTLLRLTASDYLLDILKLFSPLSSKAIIPKSNKLSPAN